jgi:ABC-type transport system involved in multi-copper enzyme maturation permease subunit
VIALLASEFRRFRSRDVVRMFIVAVLIGIAIAGVLTAINSKGPSSHITAQGQRGYEHDLAACQKGRYGEPPPGATIEEYCSDQVRLENYRSVDQRFDLFSLPEILQGSAFLVVIGGLLLGASAVGAEWHHGTMTTLLTWEPRRIRVLAAKAVVAGICVFVIMVVLLAILGGALALVAATRGNTTDLGDHFLRSVAGVIARIAGCASAGSLVGMGIAMLARSTAAAIGIGFAYLGIVEGLIRGLRPGWQHFLLGDNIAVVIIGRDDGIMATPTSFTRAGVTVAAYAAILLVAAAAAFRARDVN